MVMLGAVGRNGFISPANIEDEWLHLKYDELAAQVFEDEYEVALALIAAIEARGQRGNYPVERFQFNHV